MLCNNIQNLKFKIKRLHFSLPSITTTNGNQQATRKRNKMDYNLPITTHRRPDGTFSKPWHVSTWSHWNELLFPERSTKMIDSSEKQPLTVQICLKDAVRFLKSNLISTDVKQPTGCIIWSCGECISIGEVLKLSKDITMSKQKYQVFKDEMKKQLETYCYCIDIWFMSSKCLSTNAILYAPQLKNTKTKHYGIQAPFAFKNLDRSVSIQVSYRNLPSQTW